MKKDNEGLEQKVIDRTAELERIIQQLEEYKYFYTNTNDLFSIANHEGCFDALNSSYEKVLGYTQKALSENSFLDLIHPDDISATLQEYEKLKSGVSAINFINRCRKKDGSYLWFEWNVVSNTVTGKLYCIGRDVTEGKKIKEQLSMVNSELEAFIHSVSHDLRTPLRAINGYAQMFSEDYSPKLDEAANRHLDNIRLNATLMDKLIDDLLAFSRLGRKEIQKTNIDMNELTKGLLIDLNKTLLHSAEIEIGKLHSVKGDYTLMRQVMLNLISNGVKFSSKKENPTIEIYSEERNSEIVFSVKDNGAGFDMRYADKLFGVFQRLHKAREFEGTGVGLAIVQRIINKHGGRIWAEAELERGATFSFVIPN